MLKFWFHQIFLEKDILLENISPETPIFVITEGNEPSFFTRFFTWNSAKSTVCAIGVCLHESFNLNYLDIYMNQKAFILF